MIPFREWQELSQTKAFVDQLKHLNEQNKEEAVSSEDRVSIEQIAMFAIERQAETRVLETIINILTSKEEENYEQN